MGATDRFTRREFQRLLDVTDKQLSYWERLRLVSPRKGGNEKFYDFRDLISLRTAKQLIEKGVSANRLRRSLVALNQKLSEVQAPLTELRILSNGRDVIVERDGARLEPISGQFVLNFDTRELGDKVRYMPERGPEDWYALALQYEADPNSRAEAIDAYQRVLATNPSHIDALINLGMLSYDDGNVEKATECFQRAAAFASGGATRSALCRRALQFGVCVRQAQRPCRSARTLAALRGARSRKPLVRLRTPAPRPAQTLTVTGTTPSGDRASEVTSQACPLHSRTLP